MKKILRTLCLAFVFVFVGIVLTACKPANIEKAKAKMEDAGYTVVAYDKGKDAEGFVGAFSATKVDLKDGGSGTITAWLFDSKESAEKYQKAIGDTAVQDGKWVYVGTEAAVDAFLA